jgi:hypothetical protein
MLGDAGQNRQKGNHWAHITDGNRIFEIYCCPGILLEELPMGLRLKQCWWLMAFTAFPRDVICLSVIIFHLSRSHPAFAKRTLLDRPN